MAACILKSLIFVDFHHESAKNTKVKWVKLVVIATYSYPHTTSNALGLRNTKPRG